MRPLFLLPFFEKQSQLDEKIYKKFDLKTDQSLYEKVVMAFQVELMECCNDWRGFKYWTENPAPKETLLEEYVDGLHFILSLGNLLEESNQAEGYFPSGAHVAGTSPFVLFALCSKLASLMYEDNYYHQLLCVFLDLGYTLGFSWEQITEAYDKKYEINIKRQEDGY